MEEADHVETEREAADKRRAETINDMIDGLGQQVATLKIVTRETLDSGYSLWAMQACDVRVHLEALIGRLENL